MIRSMFTAISALNQHQSYLDVVANNLANANTTGFKAYRVLFQDQFSQLISPGSAPNAAQGGINPTQIGTGVKIGNVAPLFIQGTLQGTGRSLDLAIQGDGFFVYDRGAGQRYSRDGAVNLDANGNLVNSSTGFRLQGWQAVNGVVDPNGPIDDIQIDTQGTLAQATSQAGFSGNLDAETATGDTVDATMGVYDSLGQMHNVAVSFTRTGPSDWAWAVTAPAGASGSGTITFDLDGQISAGGTGTIDLTGSPGANPIAITADFSAMTQLVDESSATVSSQNGLPAGTVSDVYVTPNDGTIQLIYTNGMRQQVGQVALARFTNPSGLINAGQTTFQQGLNSGEPEIGTANSGSRGGIASGYLEASNVDMAQEFTNMILAQRGFQASSRVISTSDEILQELVNLRR